MKGVHLGLLVLLCTSLYVTYGKKDTTKSKLPPGEKRLNDIKKISKRYTVVDFTSRTFRRLVANGPRPYHTIIFFSSNSSQFKCPSCQRLHPEFVKLADLYKNTISGDWDKAKVFFGIVELSQCQEVFQLHRELIPALPQIVHIPPEEDKVPVFWTQGDTYKIEPQSLSAETIAQWVMERTKERIFLPRTTSQTYGSYAMIIFFVIMVLRRYDLILEYYRNPMFWYACALLVCIFTSVGTVYNWIRTPPLFWRDPRSGGVMFIYPQMRSQFVLEGVIVTVLLGICSGSFIMLNERVPHEIGNGKTVTSYLGYLMTVFGSAFCILSLFRFKFRGYPY